MRSLFFGFIFIIISSYSAAQNNRSRNSQPYIPGSTAPRDFQSFLDRSNFSNPDVFNRTSRINDIYNFNAPSRNYPIFGFTPDEVLSGMISLNKVNNIKLIDARFDTEKIGFLPVGIELKKNGYTSIGIKIDKDLLNWLTEGFINKHVVTNDSSNRQLVIVIDKFWISSNAVEHYTVSKPKLVTTLQYQFDVFSCINQGYYPQKKISGSINTLFNNGSALKLLTDSIISILKSELEALSFTARETESNWQSAVDFNDYYNSRFRRVSNFGARSPGVYATYEDFLNNEPICDSVEMIRKLNNYERASLYACIISGVKDGLPVSCNQFWGYFNGIDLFVNAGSGIFIKLIRSKENYGFFHLENIQRDNIKRNILEGMKIGETPYLLLRDYTKAFMLTYQLDPETGKLF